MNHKDFLHQYLNAVGSKEINPVAALYLGAFADWLDKNRPRCESGHEWTALRDGIEICSSCGITKSIRMSK